MSKSENHKRVVLNDGILLYSDSKLQCVRCGKFLSFKPVSETDGGQFTCGRCCPQSKQCALYDAIAQQLRFSCAFTGCMLTLKWGEVEAHEKTCYFRHILCPLPDCVDSYQLSSQKSHFENAHITYGKSYCSSNINLTNSIPYVNVVCILYEEVTFIVLIKIFSKPDSEEGRYTVKFLLLSMPSYAQHPSNHDCEVKINISSNIALTNTVDCSYIMQYSESKHCLRCLYNVCEKPDHMNIGDALLTHELAFETKSESTSYAIKFRKKLINLRCTICPKDFGRYIYMCHICGKSFCSEHYYERKLEPKCPVCKAALNNCTRNYCLEQIVREYRDTL